MNQADRSEAVITARLLQGAGSLDWLSIGLTVVAAGALAFGEPTGRIPAIAAVVLGFVARLFAVRAAFDAGFFEAIAGGNFELRDLDLALVSLDLAPKTKIERPWSQRCRGARRLVAQLGVITLAQIAALVWMSLLGGNP